MRVEWKLFAGAGAFFSVTGLTYWFVTYEHAGTVMLLLAVAALLMLGGYLFLLARRHGLRPEDRPDARPEDGAGDLGYFPANSLWPFAASIGAVVLANAFVFGSFLAVVGIPVLVTAVIGFAREAQNKQ